MKVTSQSQKGKRLTHVDLSVEPQEIPVAGREGGGCDGRHRQQGAREGVLHLVVGARRRSSLPKCRVEVEGGEAEEEELAAALAPVHYTGPAENREERRK